MPVGPDKSIDRYDRQLRGDFLDADAQRKLGESTVMLVGVGGLGSWTASLLARAGVGRLRLIDPDIVETVNLHRQNLYTESDVGWPKVSVAARRLRSINSQVTVVSHRAILRESTLKLFAPGADLIIDGTDNFATRYLINDYAVANNIPWIFTGVVATEGQFMVVRPGLTACLRCLMPDKPDTEITCMQLGVFGPAVAMHSARQAAEAIKLLSGNTEALSPYLEKTNLWTNTVQRLRCPQDPECPCCVKRHFEFWSPS
jgi:molybdopterin/thiamine biosynthesis adenylyltransferase